MRMPACELCQKILDLEGGRKCDITNTPVHRSWNSFIRSIDEGCPICLNLWREIGRPSATLWRDEPGSYFESYWQWINKPKTANITCQTHWRLGGAITVHFLPCHPLGSFLSASLTRLIPGMPVEEVRKLEDGNVMARVALDKRATLDSSIGLIAVWLSRCQTGHARCQCYPRPSRGQKNYPTRLIDLRTDLQGGLSETWSIVIPEESDAVQFTEYIAVSHRWTEFTPKLFKKHLDRLQKGQPDAVLPPRYQGVFSLCRKLGVRYVWIDSLCIFQDSEDDFRHEASTMTEVYAGALCTLSLSWSSELSCLNCDRDTYATNQRIVSQPIPKHDYDPWNASLPEETSSQPSFRREAIVCTSNDYNRDVVRAPLYGRGWVFQESILAPRVIHVGHDQLYWQCQEELGCETFPWGVPPILGAQVGMHYQDLKRQLNLPSNQILGRLWPQIVEKYSWTTLTYESDRLVAISGLARLVASRVPDDYLAGLWKRRILFELCWSKVSKVPWLERETTVRPGRHGRLSHAPSWSWASSPYPIRMYEIGGSKSNNEPPNLYSFQAPGVKPLAYLQDSHVTPLGPDIFGQIQSASITLTSYLIPLDSIDRISGSGRLSLSMVKLVDPDQIRSCNGENCYIYLDSPPGSHDTALPRFLLPLLLQVNSINVMYGLIIQQQPDIPEDPESTEPHDVRYIRIGMFMKTDLTSNRVFANTLKRAAWRIAEGSAQFQSIESRAFKRRFVRYFGSSGSEQDGTSELNSILDEWAFEGQWTTVTLV
ncbi:heterokaryon incompatibility protein-domain-containing protein [Hypomontagnella monticulosa]|nr:heterokaryon incompatibility protein-domain-containing protein [Hypomontagnella monticulosa]